MTTVKIEKGPGFDQAVIEIKKFTDKMADEVRAELEDTGLEIRNNMIKAIDDSPASGRTYRRGSKTHVASSKGNAPRSDSGGLKNSIKTDVRNSRGDFIVETGSKIKNPKYPVFLETGTRHTKGGSFKMFPRPYVAPAFKKGMRGIEQRILDAIERA